MNKNILNWFRRNCDRVGYSSDISLYGTYHGTNIRLSGDNKLEVGNTDFDRWANSVAYVCKLDPNKNIERQVNLAIVEARKDTRDYWSRSVGVMKNMLQQGILN